jgi:hypothetical protein
MRSLAASLLCLFILVAPAQAADMPARRTSPPPSRPCGDFCRHLDGSIENCGLNERPVYDQDGECSCEPDNACSGRKSSLKTPTYSKYVRPKNTASPATLVTAPPYEDDFSTTKTIWRAWSGTYIYSPGSITFSTAPSFTKQSFLVIIKPTVFGGNSMFTANISLNCHTGSCFGGIAMPYAYMGGQDYYRFTYLEAVIDGTNHLKIIYYWDNVNHTHVESILSTQDISDLLNGHSSIDLKIFQVGGAGTHMTKVWVGTSLVYCAKNSIPFLDMPGPALTISGGNGESIVAHHITITPFSFSGNPYLCT